MMEFEDKVRECLEKYYNFESINLYIKKVNLDNDIIYFTLNNNDEFSINKNDFALKLKEIAWNKYKECIISGHAEFGGFARLQINDKDFCMMYDTHSEADMIVEAFYWLVTNENQ